MGPTLTSSSALSAIRVRADTTHGQDLLFEGAPLVRGGLLGVESAIDDQAIHVDFDRAGLERHHRGDHDWKVSLVKGFRDAKSHDAKTVSR